MNHIYVKIFIDRVSFCIVSNRQKERVKIKENEIILPLSFSIGDRLFYIKK